MRGARAGGRALPLTSGAGGLPHCALQQSTHTSAACQRKTAHARKSRRDQLREGSDNPLRALRGAFATATSRSEGEGQCGPGRRQRGEGRVDKEKRRGGESCQGRKV